MQHLRLLQLAVPCRGFGLEGVGADKSSWFWLKCGSNPVVLCRVVWRVAVLVGLGAVSSMAGGRAGRGCGMGTALGGPLLTSPAQHTHL